MTKEEANYNEVHFCSFCKQFIFRYGDYYCLKLEGPVAESGYCDYFEKDGKPTPAEPAVKAKSCADCGYNMDGMCRKDGSLAKKVCSLYSDTVLPKVVEMIPPVQDIEVVYVDGEYEVIDTSSKYCTMCSESYYAGEVPMCRKFNAQLDMNDLTACEEYSDEDV
jgi:hypothetical protein